MKPISESDLEIAINQGESLHLEFKSRVPKPESVARNIAAFANTAGGTILFGVSETGQVNDTYFKDIEPVVNHAKLMLSTTPEINVKELEYKGHIITAVNVNLSNQGPVLARGTALVREGTEIRLAEPSKILSLLVPKDISHEDLLKRIDTIAESLSRQSEELEKLRSEQEKSGKMSTKFKEWVWGGFIGAIIGIIITILLKL